jgi:hypothetical protein
MISKLSIRVLHNFQFMHIELYVLYTNVEVFKVSINVNIICIKWYIAIFVVNSTWQVSNTSWTAWKGLTTYLNSKKLVKKMLPN